MNPIGVCLNGMSRYATREVMGVKWLICLPAGNYQYNHENNSSFTFSAGLKVWAVRVFCSEELLVYHFLQLFAGGVGQNPVHY